ncbi:hypothetical protein [Winogradskyella sp. 4-2091]|uniref:hypothetical protein n=1 Tax=Winogradskyella sp. 4-2091 TaxID=3381659 RepID=UPI003892BB7B
MKTICYYLLLLFIPNLISSQGSMPTKERNGTYYLLEAERGADTKMFEFGEHNGVQLLAVAACAKCMPGVYRYQEEDSKEVGVAIFYNKLGLYMIAYDDESFVMVMPSIKEGEDWTDFTFSNFYSKSKSKVDAMSKEKIKTYILKLSS